jgi:anti-sigma regulatory factor (Ser/Thr protein kinase)/putative methionine-R-sulfoxide reductase with GAF domain
MMTQESRGAEVHAPKLGVGQIALRPAGGVPAPAEQVRNLNRLTDPALSELGLDALLDELLDRVKEALGVDTVAILLHDPDAHQLLARAAKGIEEEVERGVRIPIGRGFAGRIAAERVAIYISDVDHADILNPILREKGIRSLLGIPLIVEGNLIGVLHVGSITPRTFGERDLAVLQVAAARAAPAIERARLVAELEREHEVAIALQRSLLPRRLPQMAGISVAARYLAALQEVGGDWYDVIELPRGLIGIVIGDVVGHGIRAAALMGQLRTALRSYAQEGHGAARTLELVDRFTQAAGDGAMATAAYAVFEPATGTLQFASAGHLPPIHIANGKARLIEFAPSAPLGAFPYGSVPEHTFSLGTGEMLVLYTDGLVERRGVPLNDGLDALVETLQPSVSAEDACLMAVAALNPADAPRDDVAIVALHNQPIPAELRLRLPAEPSVLADLRRQLRRWLGGRGAVGNELLEITMAVSEACANAIEHAYSPAPAMFEIRASQSADEIVVVVRDSGRWRAPRGTNRGRGLRIIETAMDDVTVAATNTGTEITMRRRLGR